MAVSFNSKITAGNNGDADTWSGDNVSSLTATSSITVAAGSNRAAYVAVNADANLTSIAATWNGTAMALVVSADTAPGTPHAFVAIFALANDSQVAASSTPTIAVTWASGSADVYMGAIVFNGVQQSANGVNSANNVSDNTGDLTIDVTGTSDGATIASTIRNGSDPTGAGSGNTIFWAFDDFSPGGAGAYRVGLTGTNSYDFNSGTLGSVRASAGINIISDGVAASGGGPLLGGALRGTLVGGSLVR